MESNITKTFYEVAWSPAPLQIASHPDNPVFCNPVNMWYVSDPFSSLEAAKGYAKFRQDEDCTTEVLEVVKTKRKVA